MEDYDTLKDNWFSVKNNMELILQNKADTIKDISNEELFQLLIKTIFSPSVNQAV